MALDATPQTKISCGQAEVEASPLPCLDSDSSKVFGDTLRYSDLQAHQETGDLLGTDLRLVRRGVGWEGSIALTQGALSQYAPIQAIKLNLTTGDLTLGWEYHRQQAAFQGKLTRGSLIGEFRWGPLAEVDLDTLPRSQNVEFSAPAR